MSGSNTRQITQYPVRSPVLVTDNILVQEGGPGTSYGFATVGSLSSIFSPVSAVAGGGATSGRPANPVLYQGYFDTTLGFPIWWTGVFWVNAAGALS